MSKAEDKIKALQAAADNNAPYLRQAFFSVIEEIRANLFDTAALEIAIAQKDINAMLRAIQIDQMDNLLFGIGVDKSAYIFTQQAQNIFAIGAATSISLLSPTTQKMLSFDSIGERAIRNIRADNLNLVSGLTSNSRAGVLTAIERSLAEGTNPARQAREIRQLIGLTSEQTQAVLNFRRQLETRQVLGFTPPGERRFDAVETAMINRHMKEGTFSTSQIDAMVERYYQSSINKRAWDIAHTEALNAVNQAQQEVWEQGLDQGIFDDKVDRKFWIVTRDDRLRPSHAAIPGMNPNGVKIRSQFVTPFGLVYSPGDRNANLINCRCTIVLGEAQQTYHSDGYLI